jgi:hypothetical protein
MMTGKLGWRRAVLTDPAFNYYLYHGDYFQEVFDISPEANKIIKSIFTLDPAKRMSLRALRQKIVDIKTFGSGRLKEVVAKPKKAIGTFPFPRACEGLPTGDVSTDSSTLPSSTSENSETRPAPKLRVVNGSPSDYSSEDTKVKSISASSSLCSNEIVRLTIEDASRSEPSPPIYPSHQAPIMDASRPRDSEQTFAAVFYESDDSESGEESDGPETPETRAIDDDAAVAQEVEILDLGSPGARVELELRKEMSAQGKVQMWIRQTHISLPRREPATELELL